jgi:ATPase subunit of ABC transporter with duplicated ATPase domains
VCHSGIIWLENFLQQWPKTIILVSHDRNFLNTVCDRIMLIFGGKMEVYKGNYDTFESARTERMKQLRRAICVMVYSFYYASRCSSGTTEAQQTKRAHIQSFIDR